MNVVVIVTGVVVCCESVGESCVCWSLVVSQSDSVAAAVLFVSTEDVAGPGGDGKQTGERDHRLSR